MEILRISLIKQYLSFSYTATLINLYLNNNTFNNTFNSLPHKEPSIFIFCYYYFFYAKVEMIMIINS